MILTAQRAVRLFNVSAAKGNAETAGIGKINLGGQRRVVGVFEQDAATAPAAGYPRIRQSADGVNWSLTLPLAQDMQQLALTGLVVFNFDEIVRLPYVAIEWVNSAAPTNLRATAWAMPV